MSTENQKTSYDASSIKVLEGLDAVRERPGMYIGSTGPAGIAQLIYEIVDNGIDEHTAGFGNEISVEVKTDGTVTVVDHGRGIPVGPHPTAKDKDGNSIDTLTLVLTTLHAGGKMKTGHDGYAMPTAGLHGVGSSCVQALSDYFEAIVKRDGKIYQQKFSRGKPTSDVNVIGETNETGTTIIYHPDKQIFKNTFRPPADVKHRFIELASLNGGLSISYKNEIDNFDETYFYEDGIVGYTSKLAGENKLLFDKPLFIEGDIETSTDENVSKKFKAEIALIYDDEVEANTKIHSFANNISTIFGGYHVNGFKNALKDVLNDYAIKTKMIKSPIEMKYYLDGLFATVSVKIHDVEFEGQTKQKLGNEEAAEYTSTIFRKFFEDHAKDKSITNILEAIIQRSIRVKDAEEAARKARMEKRATNKVSRQSLPIELADCVNAGTSKYSELLLVEGQSAAGCIPIYEKIQMADGSLKSVEELLTTYKGKKLFVSCVDEEGNICKEAITDVFKTKRTNKLYKIVFSNGKSSTFTGNHLIMAEERKWVAVMNTHINMNVLCKENGNITKTKIKGIVITKTDEDVYDITVNRVHNFIMESGIIAHNSTKVGRYPEIQAVLPLRGKVLNVEKASLEQLVNSPAIQRIIAALGTGFGKSFDISKLRYDKVVILCFKGDTKVKMLDGTVKTFEELVEMEKKNPDQDYWVYSCMSDGKVVPGKMRHPRITQYVNDTIKITLDNGDVFEVTPNHKFMLRSGSYQEAKDLKPGMSLMPLNTRINEVWSHGREEVYDHSRNIWVRTHRMVMETLNNIHSGREWHVHHINENFLDNRPTNLEWKYRNDHMKTHSDHIINYNQSQAHRDLVKSMHKAGIYEHTYWGNNGYNGSEAQKEMLRELNSRPEIKAMKSEIFTNYNHSEKNKETTRAINKREDVKLLQKQGKVIHAMACLIRKGLTLTQNMFIDKKEIAKLKDHVVQVPSNAKITELFASFDEAYERAKEYEQNGLTDEMFKQLTNVEEVKKTRIEANKNTKRNSMAKIGKQIFDRGWDFNEENYKRIKGETSSKAPKWENWNQYFDSFDDLIEASKNYNHKVAKIEHIHYDEAIPMYCGTVEDYHNFAVVDTDANNGIVSRNCDADSDGNHIRALLITFFFKYMKQLILDGNVYAAVPPLYRTIYKTGNEYITDDKALKKWKEDHPNITNYELQRFKGLGEMNPEELGETVLNPGNRILKQITIEDAKEAEESLQICMGTEVAPRRKFIEENAYLIGDLKQ